MLGQLALIRGRLWLAVRTCLWQILFEIGVGLWRRTLRVHSYLMNFLLMWQHVRSSVNCSTKLLGHVWRALICIILIMSIFKTVIRHRLIILDGACCHIETVSSRSPKRCDLKLARELALDFCDLFALSGGNLHIILLVHLHSLHLWRWCGQRGSLGLLSLLRSLSSLWALVLRSLLGTFLRNMRDWHHLMLLLVRGRHLLALLIFLNSWSLTCL